MNIYVTPEEIKSAAPDLIKQETEKYDGPLYRRCVGVSRAIDRRCKRHFYPRRETLYFDGSGTDTLWAPDLIEIEEVAFYVGAAAYVALDESDYLGAVSGNTNAPGSFNMLMLEGSKKFPSGRRAVRIRGAWGYTDDRLACWEGSTLHLGEAMDTETTVMEIESGVVKDRYGLGTVLQTGRLIRIDDEMMFVRSVTIDDTNGDTALVVRAQNGREAQAHPQGTEIYMWRPPMDISLAAMISAMRDLSRAQQGYADVRGGLDVGGRMLWVGRWDPEAEDRISRYIKTGVG